MRVIGCDRTVGWRGSLRERRWGRVINRCSLKGVNARLFSADCNMPKEAPHGMGCNAICPGVGAVLQKLVAAQSVTLKPVSLNGRCCKRRG